MFTKKFEMAAGLLLLTLFFGCATAVVVTTDSVYKEMATLISEIRQNREGLNKLRTLRIGATGFFYVIDADGTVVYHPKEFLIGSSFSKYWFIKKIMENKTGCLSYQLGNRTHLVIYDQINDTEILCLSILTEDLRSPPASCVLPEVK